MHKIIPILILLFIWSSSKSQDGVYIEIGEKGSNVMFGQGILKSRGGECFVISPAHLFNDATENFRIIGSNNRLSTANNLESFEFYDLAISRVVSGEDQNCSAWAVPLDFKQILNKAYQATVETKLGNGETEIITVQIDKKESENINISPLRADQRLKKGYSGSPVYVNESGRKILIGILLEVEDGGKQGSLLPANDMERVLGGFFDGNTTNAFSHTPNIVKNKKSSAAPILEPFEDIGIKYELIDYKKSGSKLTFDYVVSATQKDEVLTMYTYNVILYDEKGFEVKASKIKIGTKNGHSFSYNLIQGIQTPISFTFDNIPSNASGISLLKVVFQSSLGSSEFQIRNLPMNKNAEFVKNSYESTWSFEDVGIQYDLLDYRKSGSKLTFDYVVSATQKDEVLTMYTYNVILYDENGFEVKASKIKIGTKNGHSFSYNLIQGIQTPISFIFDNIPSNASGISLLKVVFQSSLGSSEFQIRNLPMNKNAEFVKNSYESTWSFEDVGIQYDLLDYRKSGSKLTFDYVVSATQKDEVLTMYTYNVILYDENGFEVKASKIKIGTKNGHSFSYNLIQGIQTPISFTFDNIPSNASGISLLKVVFQSSLGSSEFQIRNLPMNKNAEFVKNSYESTWSFEDVGIQYDLLDYRKSGSKLTFDYVVSATQKDEVLTMYTYNVILYDENGFEVKASKIKIGTKNGHSFSYNLIQGIQTPISFTFDNIPSNASGISLLKVVFQSSLGSSEFQIRNLPMNKNAEFVKNSYESTWSFEDVGIQYDLLDYRKSGSKLTFDYVVSATQKDEVLTMYTYNVILYDENGFEVKASKIKIGTKNGHSFSYNLIQGIQTPISFTFDNIPSNASGISLLKVVFQSSLGSSEFQIRNLKLI